MTKGLTQYIQNMKPSIEEGLRLTLKQQFNGECQELKEMLAYHMGWEDNEKKQDKRGKRIRPILLLLCMEAVGADWRKGLQAAIAVEYLHNFSLIHDDIQDQSPLRHGRETIWKKWGVAQGVNTGDFMFTMAHLAMLDMNKSISSEIVIQASTILHNTSIQIMKGQYMDLFYETQNEIQVEDYWPMISGKTAALIGCCSEIGALFGGAEVTIIRSFSQFGLNLGLAFQVQDDWLGIWGDEGKTGKSIKSDLVAGKKTLPILYSLALKGDFSKRWHSGNISHDEIPELANLLTREGVKEYTENKSKELTNKALSYLEINSINNNAKNALYELACSLTTRQQ